MKQVLISYTTKPERTEENARLIQGVVDELKAHMPAGLRYFVLRDENGRFSHFVQMEEGAPPLNEFASFQAFQQGASERCLEGPVRSTVTIIGSYGMLSNEF
jgi:hypothetical protein